MEGLWTSKDSISNGSKEEFWLQIYCKNWFFDRVFYIIIAAADIGSLMSLHTFFGKYFDHMLVKFEQNRMVGTIQNFEVFHKKIVNHFWQCVEAILKDVFVTETIVWCWAFNLETIIFECSKNNGNQVKTCTKHDRPNQS